MTVQWTDKERRLLREYRLAGATKIELSERFRRPKKAIAQEIAAMGLPAIVVKPVAALKAALELIPASRDWPPFKLDRLRTLWASGVPAMEIGRLMSISKNSVVGKVHRLKLEGRPSPIKPRDPNAPPRKHVQRAPIALPSLSSHPQSAPRIAPRQALGRLNADTTMAVDIEEGAPVVIGNPFAYRVKRPSVSRLATTRTCQFPMWGHQERAPRPPLFCDARATAGSYCAAHAALCWIGAHRREGAMA